MTGSAVKHPEERATALEFQWDSVARLIKYILLNGGGVRGGGEQVECWLVLASADDGKRSEASGGASVHAGVCRSGFVARLNQIKMY